MALALFEGSGVLEAGDGDGVPDPARQPGGGTAALDPALALDPTFAKDPRGAYRLHRVPDSLIDQFMDGLHGAGLEIPRAAAG